MNYTGALAYLNEVQEMGAKLTLDNIQKIVNHLPLDLRKIKFIQVAGTNGKGSTAHFLVSILQAAGNKVGLFTSPHLQDIRERITINKAWIPEKDFAECLTQVKDTTADLLEKGLIDNMPTYFENVFLTALHYFCKEHIDIAVLEVGLGGRLDATSTITPEISIITNISFDHTRTLGKRLRDIAAEKAGIIKPGVPLVCGCRVRSLTNRVIMKTALDKRAPFANVLDANNRLEAQKRDKYYQCTYTTESDKYLFEVHLNGEHQTNNAAAAVKAVQILNKRNGMFNISKQAIAQGTARNFVPARIETINSTPRVILDGGHNIESIKALRNFLAQENEKNLTLVFGVLRDKKYRKMIPLLLPYASRVILTEPPSRRALPAENLIKFFNTKDIMINKKPGDAFGTAKQFKEDILITGSLYLAGEIRNLINGG